MGWPLSRTRRRRSPRRSLAPHPRDASHIDSANLTSIPSASWVLDSAPGLGGRMLGRFGDALVRRRRLVLIATLGFVLLAGLIGGKVADRLSSGGFTDPGV